MDWKEDLVYHKIVTYEFEEMN
ncbi:unnamed protein product, partial [Allacma fusca]